MKYKWGGLLETLEETDGNHGSEKLLLIQEKILALENSTTIEQVANILIFLEKDKDYLCSKLLDHLLVPYKGFPCTAIEYDDIEMWKFLEERIKPLESRSFIDIGMHGAVKILMYIESQATLDYNDYRNVIEKAIEHSQLKILKYLDTQVNIKKYIDFAKVFLSPNLLEYFFDKVLETVGTVQIPHIAILYRYTEQYHRYDNYYDGKRHTVVTQYQIEHFIHTCGERGLKFTECFAYYLRNTDIIVLQQILSYCDREEVKKICKNTPYKTRDRNEVILFFVKEELIPVEPLLIEMFDEYVENIFIKLYGMLKTPLSKKTLLYMLRKKRRFFREDEMTKLIVKDCNTLTRNEFLNLLKEWEFFLGKNDTKETEIAFLNSCKEIDMNNDLEFIEIVCKNKNLLRYFIQEREQTDVEKYFSVMQTVNKIQKINL